MLFLYKTKKVNNSFKKKVSSIKKVYIEAVLEKNLGDDLFLNILCERYKNNAIFYTQTNTKYNKKYLPPNLKMCSGIVVHLINGVCTRIFKKRKITGRFLKNKSDVMISIGGSIFAEWGNEYEIAKHFEIYDKKTPYYIIGCNFGPYKTKNFYDFIKTNVLKNAQDVCFRDYYSFECFKDLKNVRLAPDIIFTLKNITPISPLKKRIVFSIIDCDFRFSPEIANNYKETMKKLIIDYINQGFEVNLMSFCKEEKDEKAIKEIIDRIQNKSNITTYFYDGNVNEALQNINNSDIIVASRFHANILGLKLEKKLISIAYSDKTINALKDIKYQGEIFDIRDVKKFNYENIKNKEYEAKIDFEKISKEAEKHFYKIDMELGDKNE